MVKEERAATEGIENPAFNISSADLSAYQTSEEKVIRRDKLDSTLAAHQQKLRLQAHAEPRGNEYSRNYFDPVMDEEINPRQSGMEVSGEVPINLDEKILYGELMKLLDEENKMVEYQAARVICENFSDSVRPVSFTKTLDLRKEVEDEGIPPYIEQFEKDVQDDIILLGSFALEQDLKVQKEVLHHNKQMLHTRFHKPFQRIESQPWKVAQNARKHEIVAKFGNLAEVNNESNGAAGLCWKHSVFSFVLPDTGKLSCIQNYTALIVLNTEHGIFQSHQVEPVGTQHTLAPEPQFPGLTTIRQKQEEGKDKHSHKNGRKSPLRLLKRGSPTPLPSKSGQPLTSSRDPDTHKGSIPTVVKEVGKPFNAVKGREEFVSKETGRKREEKSLKCFQQAEEAMEEFKLKVKDQKKPQQKGNYPCQVNSGGSDKYYDLVPVKEDQGISYKLSQIRRRKKRTCDDMFSELMQLSRTDRAQLNAWRHSVAEARKALSDRNGQRKEAMLRLMGEQTDMMRHLVELQESQEEHRPSLHPLYNRLPSSPSSISCSPRSPRTRGDGGSGHPATPLQRMAQATEGCHSNSFDL
ncbi:Orofacial cleft 1 candidate gene 1 protein like protein [Chelonia mydas]|uniref:Orofacial cleft 1 candidate gene 1 protein like protein n=1 Tax=Chelonia mydas TaxID=8469 RepID=M7BHT9_CHEMY|nr:Orofacial cleft 1 candidate gene 1 protein like protein [Chelonia mydas]